MQDTLLTSEIKLYHGSYVIVEKPDLSKCAKGKDFGQGFYVTTDKRQAERFTKTSIKKAKTNGVVDENYHQGYVTTYTFKKSKEILMYELNDANSEWLHCVVAHRRSKMFRKEVSKWGKYDIIYGKIANDNTNLVITAYIDGLYGELMSEQADRIAIGFLEPENLRDQLCFRTQKAIDCLTYVKHEEIVL